MQPRFLIPREEKAAQSRHGAQLEQFENPVSVIAPTRDGPVALAHAAGAAQRIRQWALALARAGVDYCGSIGGRYHSVPCQHARTQVDVDVTGATVEIFQRGQRIASHVLCAAKRRHTTIAARMPAGASRSGQLEREHAYGATATVEAPRRDSRTTAGSATPSPARLPQLPQCVVAEAEIRRARLELARVPALKHGAVSYKSVQAIFKNWPRPVTS